MNAPHLHPVLKALAQIMRPQVDLVGAYRPKIANPDTPFEGDEVQEGFEDDARDEFIALLDANPAARSELVCDATGYMGGDVCLAIYDAVKAGDGAALFKLMDEAMDKAFNAEVEVRAIKLQEAARREGACA